MTVPSKKSSSSPIRSRPNPSLRNSEVANPIRRSFTGNPFAKPSIVANPKSFNPNTPANSPSENPRRSSVGRATVVTFREVEDKENGKDRNWKQIRVRSPSGEQGTKNFMSPTISAASKVTASPKKKILAERNEPVRSSSASLSDLNSPSCNPTMEDSEHVEVCFATPLVFKTPKTPKGLDLKDLPSSKNKRAEPVCVNATEGHDSVNLDPSFKISPPPSCPVSVPVIAPLDADPSAPPYDPKTNYLSPRPQFLHYRPNPRIESYLREGTRLEDSFISGSFSDTEITEDTQSENSQKELEDITSDAVEIKEQLLPEENEEGDEEEEEEVHASEPSPISPTSTIVTEKEAVEAKGSSKPCFWRSKFTALLLLLAVGLLSVSVIHPLVINSSVFKDLSFLKEYDQAEVAEFASTSFNWLAENFRVWSANSLSFISEFVSHLRGEHNLGPLQYCNLTALMADVSVDGYSVFDHSDKEMAGQFEFVVLGHTTGSVVDIEDLEEEVQTETGEAGKMLEADIDPKYEDLIDEEAERPVSIDALEERNQPEIEADESFVKVEHDDPEYEEQVEKEAAHADVIELESSEPKQVQEENVGVDCINSEPESMNEETELISQADQVQIEVYGVLELQAESEMSTGAEVESLQDNSPLISEVDLTVDGTESKVSMLNVLGIASLVSTLIGCTAFIYARKKKTSASDPAMSVVQPLLTKKLGASPPMPVNTEHTFQETSWNWPCPSEMSSFQKSSSYRSKGLKASDEAQSQERRPRKNQRRESVASIDSSMGSPSYGSFTTYEKIPVKNQGLGEEEIVTPVRRSSRINKQVTS